ncbi:AfsR/SARP family transcriptional regulator [Streptomyces endophyticus]|uniref:Winged helix-turn-helix domain-containing protein n=1 Tax=Streptomyces endophyticus TaxID=714166 RepID=A0ABU6F254_9ACTN|nr:BTAD domain-containing putative transcriptional regulator [Streptomyces endophyticus]MEB8338063.1 winged helix-turn-helix domain-containing protein [Streptomyces endophyticus]
MLAALALRPGRLVSREQVLDAVWGDRPPGSGHKVLPSYVYELRRSLDASGVGPEQSAIRGERGGYRFAAEGARLDVMDLAELVEGARRTREAGDTAAAERQLADALDLFDGEPLAGLPGPYAASERQRLLQRRRTAHLEWLDCLIRLGRCTQALDALASLPASDPYDESLPALRMRALYGCGRQAEALSEYEELRIRLRDELGVDPGEDLRRVHEAVLRHDDAALGRPAETRTPHVQASATAPAELPHVPYGFTGRVDELAHLDALLPTVEGSVPGPARTVVISAIGGAAGIGKTALAVHWAHQVRDRFPDGQLYVNLHGFDHERPPLEPSEALELFLRSLGVEASQVPASVDAQARAFRTLVSDRRVLVLLDNAASAEQVRPLLPGGPSCCVVVTSRNRLGDLVALDGAQSLPLDFLAPDEACALLSRALGADRIAGEPHAADRLIDLCGGLPLALRVAAARLAGDPGLGLGDLADDMSHGTRLEALELDGDINSPLRRAFSVSYGVLAPPAQRLFRLLGLFPGAEFTASVAAALLDVPTSRARRLLGTLAAAHLIESATPGRYRFHDLLREYARECTRVEESAEERAAALTRVLLWYVHATRATAGTWFYPILPTALDTGGSSDSMPSLPSTAEAARWLEEERANLLAAIHHAGHHGPYPIVTHLLSSLLGYFWLHVPRATWQALAHTALDAAAAENDLHGQAVLHSILGITQWDRGRPDRAMEHCTRVREISNELGWPEVEAMATGVNGYVDWSTAHLNRAHEGLSAGLAITRDIENHYFEAFGLLGLGMTARDLGRLHEAADHLEQALRRNRNVTWWSDSLALQVLGPVYWELGRLTDGLAALAPKVTTGDNGGYRIGHAMMLDAAAKIHVELGNYDAALEATERALGMFRSPARHWIQSGILTTVASAHRAQSRFEAALRAATESHALARKAHFRRAEADSLMALALTRHDHGHPSDAARPAEEALILSRRYGFRVVEGQALTILSAAALAESAYPEATSLAERALTTHRATGHRLGEARALTALAHAVQPSNSAAAARLREQATLTYTEVGVPEAVYGHLLG